MGQKAIAKKKKADREWKKEQSSEYSTFQLLENMW